MIMVTTTPILQGYKITQYLGIVKGIIVRSPTITQGISARIKGVIGGTIGAFKEMCEQTRRQAYQDMLKEAQGLGADAVIGMQYDSSDVEETGTEIICYGTAVKLVAVKD